ncbi:PAS domain-containing protein [Pseudoalteromonas sp. McH1-7]|uniref:sensor histidine kinase n=1 Tax=Pseudoalteromonas TaxID=53246 RepID=UPI0015915ACE|nr:MULTISPECIES: two-component regulator propeller domain-containing protein [Pseudoalteromonas]MDW7550609.1 two-component regulator propeller domain-containing protein [Pseudoalteromonas peptidolytica]NUZ09183.1 PAS domain-containing protein [Pseudoalteromonas sp. McH1-7]USD30152.1 PAS domain-containing protein [Pseudoalteromonas sp. SCSIO 43201]
MLLSLPSIASFPEFSDTAQVMRRYDYSSGLSQVTITAITQDQLGYIWVGTQSGLNRFDGHDFIQFEVKQNSKNHLSGGFITSLCHSGKYIWIGTSTGLSVYDAEAGLFRSILAAYNDAINSDRVKKVACYGESVTVSTEEGDAYRVNYQTLEPEKLYLTGKFVRDVQETRNAFVYLNADGLVSQPKDKVGAKVILDGEFKTLSLSHGRIFAVDDEEQIIAFDTKFNKVLWKKVISDKVNFSIFQVKVRTNEILVASNNGVFVLDLQGNIKRHWYRRAEQNDGLQDNNILSVQRDRNGDLWIGTESQGLHFFSQLSESFGHVGEQNFPHAPLGHPDVRNFALDSSERLWIGTSSGLYIYQQSSFIEAYRLFPSLSAIKGSFITQVKIYDDTLWLTTRGDGVIKYGLLQGEYLHLQPDSENGPELSFNDITKYQSQILVSSRTLGLMRFDNESNRLLPFFENRPDTPSHVSSFKVVGQDLWFGSIGEGLFKYSKGQLHNITTQDGLKSNLVFMIDEDPWQRLWIASEAGVSLVDKDMQVVKTIGEQDGLGNQAVWGLVHDDYEYMWLGTSGGLSRVNVMDFAIDNFLPIDGVQAHEFNYNAAWKAPDGRIFMGGAKGFNQFFPQNVSISNSARPILVSTIELLGEPIKPSPNGILPVAPELASELHLRHDQNIISLQYSSLDFGSEKLSFYYRIKGLSDKWLKLANGARQINLLQLEPGVYRVETYTVNRFNMQSPVHEFSIYVDAPLWWNTYSKTLYGLVIIFIIVGFVRARQQRYRKVLRDNQAMSALQERLELSLWASGDELWDWHVESGCIYRYSVNPKINFGELQDKLILSELDQFVHPKDCVLLEERLLACVDGNEDVYELAIRVKGQDGEWVWVLDRGKVVARDENDKALRIAGALKDIADLKAHQQALQSLNEQLEIKVAMRTDELYKKNQKLEQAMIELKQTQEELIESEKMASLGVVVAGVAHEINTPLGIAITALSHNEDCLSDLVDKLENKTLKQADLVASIASQKEGYLLVTRNLRRAESLISNFKQVAVDQSSEVERDINLLEYINDVFDSLKPLAKNKEVQLEIDGNRSINITTFPGAIYQIMANLFNNSVIHGFEDSASGCVRVTVEENGSHWSIIYSDNGVGMDETMEKTLFEPFVTTKRNQGGCGLGMHIVYNLVTQLLKGEIRCKTAKFEGVEITIRVPLTRSATIQSDTSSSPS